MRIFGTLYYLHIKAIGKEKSLEKQKYSFGYFENQKKVLNNSFV